MRKRTKAGVAGFAVCVAAGTGQAAPAVTHALGHPPAIVTDKFGPAKTPSAPSSNVSLGQRLAAAYGWDSGAEWDCLHALWNRESGWQANIMNRSSGAFGIAQALGHGTSSAVVPLVRFPDGTTATNMTVNQYGGFGLSSTQAHAANSGDASAQIMWGLNYIQATYGDPVRAWAHETAAGWY